MKHIQDMFQRDLGSDFIKCRDFIGMNCGQIMFVRLSCNHRVAISLPWQQALATLVINTQARENTNMCFSWGGFTDIMFTMSYPLRLVLDNTSLFFILCVFTCFVAVLLVYLNTTWLAIDTKSTSNNVSIQNDM